MKLKTWSSNNKFKGSGFCGSWIQNGELPGKLQYYICKGSVSQSLDCWTSIECYSIKFSAESADNYYEDIFDAYVFENDPIFSALKTNKKLSNSELAAFLSKHIDTITLINIVHTTGIITGKKELKQNIKDLLT